MAVTFLTVLVLEIAALGLAAFLAGFVVETTLAVFLAKTAFLDVRLAFDGVLTLAEDRLFFFFGVFVLRGAFIAASLCAAALASLETIADFSGGKVFRFAAVLEGCFFGVDFVMFPGDPHTKPDASLGAIRLTAHRSTNKRVLWLTRG